MMVINKSFDIGGLFKCLIASVLLVLVFALYLKAEHQINIAHVSTFFIVIFLVWLALTIGYLSIWIQVNGSKKELTSDAILEWNKYTLRVMKVGRVSSLMLFGMFALAALYFIPEVAFDYTTGVWGKIGYLVVNDVSFMTVIYSFAMLFVLGEFSSIFERNLKLLNGE